MRKLQYLLLFIVIFISHFFFQLNFCLADNPQRQVFLKEYSSGNYKDAYEKVKKYLLSNQVDLSNARSDLVTAISCLTSLGRNGETDQLLEDVRSAHLNDWQMLQAVAYGYRYIPHGGSIIAGKFNRGSYGGGSNRYVDSTEHDRVRSLQILLEAVNKSRDEKNSDSLSHLYKDLADALIMDRTSNQAWKLQHLTDLVKLPDYDDYNRRYLRSQSSGSPVDANNNPLFYKIPKSFETAKNDGERFRWALNSRIEVNPYAKDEVNYYFAQFLQSQFGVETVRQYGFYGQPDNDSEHSSFAFHNLKDEETIARLATGVRKFSLPDEFNPIKLFAAIADTDRSSNRSAYAVNARTDLCQILENRRQFNRAADCWKRSIEVFGPGNNNQTQKRLDQIVGAWGQFEAAFTQTAGEKNSLEYKFRNGTNAAFEAYEINVEKFLEDLKTYLKDNPKQVDYNKISIDQIGYQLIQEKMPQYLGKKTADWSQPLKPRDNHFDSRITIETPLTKSGAYLIKAKMAGGNETQIVLWLADSALIKNPIDKGVFYFIGDAKNGDPISGADVNFFGYRQVQIEDHSLVNKISGRHSNIVTTEFHTQSSPSGEIIPDNNVLDSNYTWLVTAKAGDGRHAFLGFSSVWHGNYYDAEYNQTKVFAITDRPVYRPEQTVKYKLWIGNAKYDQEDHSLLANTEFLVRITNPNGETFFEKTLRTDNYGGIEGDLALPKNAQLGVYGIGLPTYGSYSTFRVEEYKKPEFEVSIEAPGEPVMLGDKIKAVIKADYYFGAPVTEAKVKYKVLRSSFEAVWYPTSPWDWFYGIGYWWFAYDYEWLPGWRSWGCKRPSPWWWGAQTSPPEVVSEQEVQIGKDGTVTVEIDTAIAKELHGNQDHKYQITAEVVDLSRRTITGSGEVFAARQPYKVYAYVDRGHYHTGDAVQANFRAQTIAGKPVTGKGSLKLLKINYQNGKETEREVEQWKLDVSDFGTAELQMKAAEPGQYRLSFTVEDKAGHSVEGGYLFTVVGKGYDGSTFRFNDIELIPDKKDYKDGEKVRLMINTNVPDSTVLLFLRPANGIYLKPEIIQIKGKSKIYEIPVSKKDMPNFFIEAITIGSAKVFQEVREITVPPEERVLSVEITPSQKTFKPGETAKIAITIKDEDGKPFIGSTTISVYDAALEYISGGSNVPDIREFFWKWRRTHYGSTESSLDKFSYPLIRQGNTVMQSIGIFGDTIADEVVIQGRRYDGRTREKMKRGLNGFAKTANISEESMGAGVIGEMDSFADRLEAKKEDSNMPQSASAAQPLNSKDNTGNQDQLIQPQIRKEFADTAFWKGSVTTDKDGKAEVEFKMPENLTEWKVKVWGIGEGTKVGQGESSVVTTKDLILRLQSPRFLVEKDEVVLSGNIHNFLAEEKKIQAKIELDTNIFELMDSAVKDITVPAKGEIRVDWRVKVLHEADTKIRMLALSTQESDAMEVAIPVHVHGMLKTESYSGAISPQSSSAKIKINIPFERRPDQSRLEIRYSPSLASAMVDALPYLVNYPYGCTEQTLNRFLPTVITQKILRDMKLDLKAIRDKRTNLNAQEIGSDKDRGTQWKRYDENPVFDEDKVLDMIKAGMDRLAGMQLSDGGWGWFSGYGEYPSSHTTAYTVHGLQIASQSGVNVDNEVLNRGISWLVNYQAEQLQLLKNASSKTQPYKIWVDDLDAFVYMVLIDAGKANQEMRDMLFRDRTHLSVYTKAMFGLALEKEHQTEKLTEILKNLGQYLIEDDENQTAYLKLPDNNYWWYWYGSEFEAQSYYLKLLARTAPQGKIASRLAKYIVNNRKNATYWSSTRDTAIAIEALAEYIQASGEDAPNLDVTILIDEKPLKQVKITKENLFTFDNKFILEGNELQSGEHTIEVEKKGTGAIYFNGYVTNFTLEDFIKKAGLEIKVNRKYYKLIPSEDKQLVPGSKGQAIEQNSDKYKREEITQGVVLKSGDLIEVELEIDSKNDYEYLIFEDLKPAGVEPVDIRSGYNGNELGAYVEFRDDRVSFFARALKRGKHSVSYKVRAETPGKFSALPTHGYGMYAPELQGNSDEMKIGVED